MADVVRGGRDQRAARAKAKAGAGAPAVTYRSKLADHMLELNAWKHVSPQLAQKVCELARQDALVLTTAIMAGVAADVAADVAANGAMAIVPDADAIMYKADTLMPTLKAGANSGSLGRHSQNVGRSLTNMSIAIRFSGITRMALPVKQPGITVAATVLHDVLLPHRSLAEMYHRFPNSFRARMCPLPDRLSEFWTACAKHPNVALLNHLLRDVPDWRRKCIPLK
jgi:hypothetical protein